MSRVLIEILNMSISGSIMILAVLLMRLLLKKAPRWISVLLFGLVAVRLILPVSIEAPFSLIPSGQTIHVTSDTGKNGTSSVDQTNLTIDSGIKAVDEYLNQRLTAETEENRELSAFPTASELRIETQRPTDLLLSVCSIIWLSGLAGILLYSLIRYLRLRYSVAEAVLYRENIYLCDQVQTPFILGIVKPRIYLPSGLEETDFTHVLAHERAHLQRKDPLWKALGFLLLAVYWFNPLMWLSYILFCRDIEAACDEKVIAGLQTPERKAYANALVSCSMNRQQVLVYPLAFGEIAVKTRVKKVLNYKKPAILGIVAAVIACVVLGGCFLTNPMKGANPESLSADERREVAVSMLSEMLGMEKPAEELAPYILTDQYQYQGAYAAYRIEAVLSDEHLYHLVISEEPGGSLPESLSGIRLAGEDETQRFVQSGLSWPQYVDESGRRYYIIYGYASERQESAFLHLSELNGQSDPDSYLEVKFTPMRSLHSEGNENFRNITLSAMSLYIESQHQPVIVIRMKDGSTIGGTYKETRAGEARPVGSLFGIDSHLYYYFYEFVDIDKVEAVILDGEEFLLK